MNKINRKGFTLVELLVTVILLGVIGAIVIYNMTSVSTSSKETEYDRYVSAVKSAAQVYADVNPEAFNDLYINKSFIYITIEDLVREGLLDEELVNPYTQEKIGLDELVKANLDSNSGAVSFQYPIIDQKEETFLVAMSDYVVWGEPYDCMQGAGSYQLALSEEDGELIILNEDTINEYNFECKMPAGFEYYDEGNISGMRTTTSGNYEITYTWVTKSGTRKSDTRSLRVLAKVKPAFKTNYDYNFNNPDFFKTEYNESTKTWKYLTYEPYIEGADKETTTFRVTKKSNVGINAPIEKVTVNSSTNDFVTDYFVQPVDDGNKTYYIETVVKGHHNNNYSYTAKGEVVMKTELIIPQSFITVATIKDWATSRNYSIADGIHSPVGVSKFEFKLSNDESVVKDIEKVDSNIFNKASSGTTSKNVSVVNTTCDDSLKEYAYVYFRAINEDGYAGEWTRYDAKMSNQLNKVLIADSNGCTDSDTCCLKDTDGSCYYTDKVKYVSFGGVKFILLERFSDGKILATYDGVSTNSVVPTQIKRGNAKEVTTSVTVYKSFDYSSPVLDNIIDEGQVFLKKLPTSYSNYLDFAKWSASTAKVVEYTGSSDQWGSDLEKTKYKVTTDSSYTYSAFIGNVTTTMFTKYGSALTHNQSYWTNDTYTSEFTVYLNEPRPHANESTTAYNVYFYYISGDNTIKQTYVGQSAKVKPLVKFKDVNICSGSGTSSDPYVIGYK